MFVDIMFALIGSHLSTVSTIASLSSGEGGNIIRSVIIILESYWQPTTPSEHEKLLLIDSMILCQSPWMLLDVDSEFSMVKTMGTRLPKMDHVDVNCLKLIVFPWQLWVAKSLLMKMESKYIPLDYQTFFSRLQ